MGLFANFSSIRKLAGLAVGLAFAVYMGFLLYSQYRAQAELHAFYLNRLLQDSERRATAVSYFFSERDDDMTRLLADNRELALYFENKALGMSMEYGLAASIMSAGSSFHKFGEGRKLAGESIYSRLLFIDATGKALLDTGGDAPDSREDRSESWEKYIVKRNETTYFTGIENGASLITLSRPYLFKGTYAGQIIARINAELVYRQFITEVDNGAMSGMIALLDRNGYLYTPQGSKIAIPANQLPQPGLLLKSRSFRFPFKDQYGNSRFSRAFITPVKETPFFLATFLPDSSQTQATEPNRFILITGGIGLLIMFGSLVIIRTTMNNAVLNARLAEISIREQAIAEKNRSLSKLTTAMEQSLDVLIICTIEGTIDYVNPYFTHLTGYDREEAAGQSLLLLGIDDESENSKTQMWEAIHTGQEWKGELLAIKKNGDLFWGEFNISPVMYETERSISCVAIRIQDITERKEAEEMIMVMNAELEQRVRERTAALEDSHRKLEKAYTDLKSAQSHMLHQEKMASIGQLAAGVAHEINNPIGFMISNLATLKKYAGRLLDFITFQASATGGLADRPSDVAEVIRGISEERKTKKIDRISEDINELIDESLDGGNRVKQIVQNLKSFAHLDETGFKQTNINDCLESTLKVVWNELKYKAGVQKNFGELPLVSCHSGQLNQVFMNLLVNAAQAIERHGEITINTWSDDEHVYVSVTDTGCGIPPNKINRIFEPFFTTKEVGKGTGLGLSISYDIIKKHHGEIHVDSEVGKGSTFTIKIPRVAEGDEGTAGFQTEPPGERFKSE